MAGLACETVGSCSTTIKNTCMAFNDQNPWDDSTQCGLPGYLSITHSPQITPFPEHRVGGRKGTCGDFGSLGEDARKMNWIVTFPYCKDDPIQGYLNHNECWLFRHYPDCCDTTTYWELHGRVSFDNDTVYDNDVNDITIITFTIKGFSDHTWVGTTAKTCDVGTGCTALCSEPAGVPPA